MSVLIKPKPISPPAKSARPFVSIHVPCHNEPLSVVEKTLTSLSQLKYTNYEVLVIDNNTYDPAIWKPIEQYCKKLGPPFRFLHFENLKGYKAGALNAALPHMNPRTEIISIVDSDYVVDEKMLQQSIPHFSDPHVAIVQYPQAYYNSSPKTAGLEQEYRSFFDNILEQANSWNAVTATGTLSLLRASLFLTDESLKWNEWCITEDAEISIHLYSKGYKGVFINQLIGRGLMPFNYYSLQRQRERWVHGNAQIIRKDLWPTIKNEHLTWKQKLSFITQLTAWFHPTLFPTIFLTLSLILASYGTITPFITLIAGLSLLTITGFIVAKVLYFSLGQRRRGIASIISVLKTTLSHFGLTGTMSLVWLWTLTSPQLPFHRTTKDPTEKVAPYLPVDGMLATFFVLGSIAACLLTSGAIQMIALGSAAVAIFFVLAMWFLIWETRSTKQVVYSLTLPAGSLK
ncbi:MAG: glycosyltransferase [Candidatus Andersenbacteria bacterium]